MRYTQKDFEIIQAAQNLVREKGGSLTIWHNSVTISREVFAETFNPEDCTDFKFESDGYTLYALTTIIGGMRVEANLNKEEYDAWIQRWSK